MAFDPHQYTSTSLVGERVELVPLSSDHVPAFLRFGLDPRIWEWMTHQVTDEAQLRTYIRAALQERDEGHALPFATLDRASGQVIGTTRFAAIAPDDLRAEIGWTWIAPSHWRTGANAEAKRLMLAFGFEELGLRRVEFKTDARNERSRAAITALGAQFEGILRSHMVRTGGGVRDSAFYSVIEREWPEVRARLDARLSAGSGST